MIAALMPTYARAQIAFDHGDGAWLWSEDGRAYLDFGAGIATSSLGHNHPHLVEAITSQAARVMHVSNLYRVPQAERLAARLVESSFADSVFFCNSGAEANEGLVKMIRRTMARTGHPGRYRIICFDGAFHGRTLAMLSATGNPKYLDGFGPAVDGFDHVAFGDIDAVRAAITDETAGILIEPIQGEGGIRPAPTAFLQALRSLCDEHGLLLGLDEVQCGLGRTGKLYAHEWAGIVPDVLSSAKGIAGGFPMGAILASEAVARHLSAGSHGTTFGGNPLACAAANAVLDIVLAPGFLAEVESRGHWLRRGLDGLVRDHPTIYEAARGQGLIVGLKCRVPNTDLQRVCLDQGLLTVAAGDNVLRLVPPLIVSEAECDEAVTRLGRAAQTLHQALEQGASTQDVVLQVRRAFAVD